MRGILFDMDGVLYNAGEPTEGARDAVWWVRDRGIPHLFVTNTTSRSRAALVEKLAGFGIESSETQILTPAVAVVQCLRSQPGCKLAVFVPPAALPEFAGIEWVPDDAERGASHVVIGDLGERWDFRTLNRAFRLLYYSAEAKLVALGMTRYWLASDGIALDVAPFVVALEHASGRKAIVFGKPSAAFYQAGVDRLGLRAEDVLMIGDDIEADIRGAQAAGLKAALVRTGKFRPEDLGRDVTPDVVLDSIAELPQWWTRSGDHDPAARLLG